MLSQLTRRLTFCALAIAFAGILASCSQASPPLPPEPSAGGAAVVEPQVITETPPPPTVEPTPTPTVEPTPTAAPTPELYPIDKTESFLDQIPAAERRCLLFRLKKDRLSDIIVRDDRASTEEIQAIGGCISGETAGRMFVGFVNREIDISLGTETSACISNGLKDTDGIALLLAFELIESESETALRNFGEYSVAPVAFDGIAVMVNPGNDFVDCLTIEEVQAIWNYGSSINNWNQVLSGFPDRPLRLYGQGHGTIGLLHFLEEMGGSDIRGDYTGSESISKDALGAGISADPDALGFIEYSDYTQFSNQVKLIAIDNGHGCVLPTAETILTGEYAPFSNLSSSI